MVNKYIRELADGFIENEMGGAEYASLHWRYDKQDWFKHCTRMSPEEQQQSGPCSNVNKYVHCNLIPLQLILFSAFKYPERVGLTLGNTVLNHTISYLYIAAPFDDAELVGQIIQAIPGEIKGMIHIQYDSCMTHHVI